MLFLDLLNLLFLLLIFQDANTSLAFEADLASGQQGLFEQPYGASLCPFSPLETTYRIRAYTGKLGQLTGQIDQGRLVPFCIA